MHCSLSPTCWSHANAAHLLNRAGFGGTPSEVEQLFSLGLDQAVAQVISDADDDYPPLSWQIPRDFVSIEETLMSLSEEERRKRLRLHRRKLRGKFWPLVSWWIHRMAYSRNPFREKLTLFWHDHFATSMFKVCHAFLMWQQNEMFRRHAYGSFKEMLQLVSRDPAMMLWLDSANSTKRRPNENFARELLELFSLGEGQYTERDIQESARAFTGYKVNYATERYGFNSKDFDDGLKTVLGKSGILSGDDVIGACLEQPQCAIFICRKLWTYYAYEDPSPAIVEELASTFRHSNYEIKAVIQQILTSAEFYSIRAIRTQLKSPLQWLIGLVRQLKIKLPQNGLHLGSPLREMGQLPFMPPDVDGWPHGTGWITTAQLLIRYNFAKHLIAGGELRLQDLGVLGTAVNRREYSARRLDRLSLDSLILEEERSNAVALVKALAWRLYGNISQNDLGPFITYVEKHPLPASDDTVINLIYLMVSTPEYQLI